MPCGWCDQQLALAQDAALCDACQAPHHAACWDEKRGCSRPGCANAPLEELEPSPAEQRRGLPAGRTHCPHCDKPMRENAKFCPHCKQAPTPDGIYHGPKRTAPGAVASLVCGIVGLFICGVILGIVALVKANEASKAMKENPTLQGKGLVIAGRILGVVALIGWTVIIVERVMNR